MFARVVGRRDSKCGITIAGVDEADLAKCSRQGGVWDVLRLLEVLCGSVPATDDDTSSSGQRWVSHCVTSVWAGVSARLSSRR